LRDRLPFEAELIARIDWLIKLRWLAVAGTALTIGLGALSFPGSLTLGPLFGVTGFIGLYNLQFFLYLRTLKIGAAGTVRLRHATLFAYTQIILDLLALAALIHFAGGVENPMAVFFVFHVIIASVLLQRRVSYLVAGLASLLFATIGGLEYAQVIPHHPLPIVGIQVYRQELYLVTSTTVLTVTLFLVAYLATSITGRLRERDRELLESMQVSRAKSEELQKLNEQLSRVDDERTRFMVLVTHELRAPISTIYSCLELALSGYAAPEKAREVLARAQNRATEMLGFIGDLLSLTRIREQAVQWEQVPLIQVENVLQEVAELMKVEAERKDIFLGVDCAPDLAPVRALPDQIKLVWTNLLSNAIKYTDPCGIVQVSLSQDAGQLIGAVRDTGIGISAEDMPRVFDEFYRASNARLVSPHGTGVGLSIVRRIVEKWGGKVWVESESDLGTKFTFVLPRADC